MAYHMEFEYKENGEDWTLCRHVSGTVVYPSSIQIAQNLMLATGYGHRNRVSDPDTLEVPRQPERWMVFLATWHVGNLVFLRSRWHHHHTVRTSLANAFHRSSYNASVEATSVFG
jgi:hypothetical protein